MLTMKHDSVDGLHRRLMGGKTGGRKEEGAEGLEPFHHAWRLSPCRLSAGSCCDLCRGGTPSCAVCAPSRGSARRRCSQAPWGAAGGWLAGHEKGARTHKPC